MFTDQQVIAALRAWWELGPGELFPGDDNFREKSMRDMRAALMAADEYVSVECGPNEHN